MAKKKTKATKSSKADKPAKKTKAKAATQSRFGEGGIKAMFAMHIEKIALGVIGLATVAIIFFAYSREGIDSSQSPDRLADVIGQAQRHMQDSEWTEVAASRSPEEYSYFEQASTDVASVNVDDFLAQQPWEPLKFPMRTKRQDPELLAVEQLEVTYGVGPLVMMPKNRAARRCLAAATATDTEAAASILKTRISANFLTNGCLASAVRSNPRWRPN